MSESGGETRDQPSRLESQRLILRPIEEGDAEGYFSLYGDARAMAHLGGPSKYEDCLDRVRQNEVRWGIYGFASWMIDLKSDAGTVVPNVALLGFSAPLADGSVPFGWLVAPQHWRKGISFEASCLVLDWFFDRFDLRVITETDPANIASRKASEKLGFQFVSDVDEKYVCSLTRAEWLNGVGSRYG